ncbi:hypothetical protein ACFU8T_18500 [Sphingobacterium spiritivorum]|uniref:Uncharacterized protein n=1 Tax=Sphingobacterium spiritivorum ATCC 33861 TaxID=525373 RepID=D7VL85_SPHSI|nr:hypothetical protein [Sphingobacterium spiritivorum]EFK58358.1 hypothetical protein HMPREF0766_11754 [Sphingobacterium spiritivorum ATCC 33861]QQT37106.1 hypothetical protein I6J01_06735 [Sphingobacterium spiritivorum]WQD33879.1 hypothetical protein U0038_20450 [Sphingobacterium spiritivorum]SUJ27888.1 Uncharacterised protein [Sphingobacterium spiritivorum]
MKKLLILIILAIGLVIESVSAQDDNGNLIYPTNFNVNNDQLVNGRIKFDSAFGANSVGISGTCGMIVSGVYKNYVTKIIAQVVFIDKDGVVKHSAPSMEFYKSNFMVNGVMTQISIAKPFEFNVGRGSMSGGHLELRYKYEFDAAANIPNLTQSGWAPAVTHNKEWFIHNKKYETIDLARTVFTGPNFICTEGVYNIVNPGNLTLENSANIATLNKIADNSYKINRIGNSAGSVTLKAVFQGKTYTKDILVGIPSSLNILSNAGGNMQGGATYGFHLEENYPLTSISWNITGGIILSGQGTNNISVKVDPNPFQTYNNLGISLQYTSDCGNGSGNKTFYIAPSGGTSPIDPGEPL